MIKWFTIQLINGKLLKAESDNLYSFEIKLEQGTW